MDTGTCHYCGKVCDIAEPTPPGVTTRFIERLAQEKAALSTEIAELRRHVSTVMQRNDALIDVWAQHETIMPDGALVPTIEAVVKRNAELEDELAAANKRVAELEAQIGGIRSPFIDTSVLIKEGSVKEVIVNGETFVLQEERDIALAMCTELGEERDVAEMRAEELRYKRTETNEYIVRLHRELDEARSWAINIKNGFTTTLAPDWLK